MLIIVALCCLIAGAEQGGFIKGFKVEGEKGEKMNISYLLYVDDIVIF